MKRHLKKRKKKGGLKEAHRSKAGSTRTSRPPPAPLFKLHLPVDNQDLYLPSRSRHTLRSQPCCPSHPPNFISQQVLPVHLQNIPQTSLHCPLSRNTPIYTTTASGPDHPTITPHHRLQAGPLHQPPNLFNSVQ